MALYESVIITRPELSLSQVDSLISQLSEIITSNTGDIKKKEYWGLRTLAYKIKKNKKGHYSMINVDSEPSAIFEFERQMRINEKNEQNIPAKTTVENFGVFGFHLIVTV